MADNKSNDVVHRFVTYNVLSSHLGGEDYFTHCKPQNLDPPTRLKRVMKKLTVEMKQNAIIGLQEVSMLWTGKLQKFFEDNGYSFTQSLYGHYGNGYMGVGIAYPRDSYSMKACHLRRVADWKRRPKKEPWSPPEQVSYAHKLWRTLSWAGSSAKKLIVGGNDKAPVPRDPWRESLRRHNNMVVLELRCKRSQKDFVVATYHMPCAFRTPQVMVIHTALAAQVAQYIARDNYNLVLMGDWNFTPGSAPYKLITKGSIPKDCDDYPPQHFEDDTWQPKLKYALRSAYYEANGNEPAFTNYSQIRDEDPFMDTLDFIFIADGWKVVDAPVLPSEQSGRKGGVLPNKKEPSDHLLVAATLQVV